MSRANPSRHGVSPARAAALAALSELRLGRHAAGESVEHLFTAGPLSERDRHLAVELVMGALRHRQTLAAVFGAFAVNGWKRIKPELQQILLLGGYQLLWLDGIPAFAAVDEAVAQAKGEGGSRPGQFVNALLRSLQREIEQRRVPAAEADAVRAIPIDPWQYCQFRRVVLPDPHRHPIDHLAAATSQPNWLVKRWCEAFGLERTREVCLAGLCRPPIVLRPNRLRTTAEALADRLREEAGSAEPAPSGDVVVVSHWGPLSSTGAFLEGWFQPQDRTAMGVVQAMAPASGQRVVDLCAGPGTKTTQMAELMNNTGVILASDKDDSRLVPVRENGVRLGLSIIDTVLPGDLEAAARALGPIDWILVDAPCSNTGVLARRPEARYRISMRALQSLSALQFQLLDFAARLATPESRIAYSTCSLEIEEDEALVTRFLERRPDWRLERSARILPRAGAAPTDYHDGGYWAILAR
ncbi:MAG TPA: transcription antitermination factor NusB [Phycisphaerae bacterium]|nr:transcription antitermination factor NusB [Phycisphaerae bacterium]HRY69589.1 transcription antitermination factor NusB [Phycisphaerae bacterium]HSA27296.1 transcription antitermination factor NusB [Phycisphaerae bacterium]